MTKILEIESCFCCSNAENCSEYNTDNCNTIPKTCPLSDKPEPITAEILYNKSIRIVYKRNDIMEYWNKLAEEINAHFLGEK